MKYPTIRSKESAGRVLHLMEIGGSIEFTIQPWKVSLKKIGPMDFELFDDCVNLARSWKKEDMENLLSYLYNYRRWVNQSIKKINEEKGERHEIHKKKL